MKTCRYVSPTQRAAPSRLNAASLPVLQIDETADFTFDLLSHHRLENSHLGTMFYDGRVDDESVTVVAHVTDRLTGNVGPARVLPKVPAPAEGTSLMAVSSFRPHVQESYHRVCCKVQI